MISSVTGARIDSKELRRSEYWVENMVSPVLFTEAMRLLCSSTRRVLAKKIDGSHRSAIFVDNLIEIGPHAALQSAIRECSKQFHHSKDIIYSTILRRNTSASKTFLDFVGRLHALGYKIDLRRVNDPFVESAEIRMALVDLLAYPFDHSKSYWHKSRISSDRRLRRYGHFELLGSPAHDWNPFDAQWRNFISIGDVLWADHHRINGTSLCPGAGMIVMALEAALQLSETDRSVTGFRLRNVAFKVALDLSNNLEIRMSLRTTKTHGNAGVFWPHFTNFSFKDGKWTEQCTGSIHLQYRSEGASTAEYFSYSWSDYEDAWISKQHHAHYEAISTKCTNFFVSVVSNMGLNLGKSSDFNIATMGKLLRKSNCLSVLGMVQVNHT